jgi:hypothetical protein
LGQNEDFCPPGAHVLVIVSTEENQEVDTHVQMCTLSLQLIFKGFSLSSWIPIIDYYLFDKIYQKSF